MSATDRAAGMLQGAGDTIQGTRHQARDWDRGGGESDREAAAQARWASGCQPATSTSGTISLRLRRRSPAGGCTSTGLAGPRWKRP